MVQLNCMSDVVLVALISSGFTIIGDLIIKSRHSQRLEDRLDRLEKKVDLHNEYGKKFGEVAIAMTAMQKDVEYLRKATKI